MATIETDRTAATRCLQHVVRSLAEGGQDPSELRRHLTVAQRSYTSLLEHSQPSCRPGFFFSAIADVEQLRALEALVMASEWWAREPDAPQLAHREAKDFRWKNVVELLEDVVHNTHLFTETFAALADDAHFRSDLDSV